MAITLRRLRRVSWLAAAAIAILLGASVPTAEAGNQPGSAGAVTAYIGQGWG